MTRTLTAWLLTIGLAHVAGAQTPIDVNDLSAPSSPAFVLLDLSPASVERPETPKAFVVNLLNRISASSGIPKDYALQVAPYWMRSHPTLTFERYQRPNVASSLAQSFAISVATSPLGKTTGGSDAGGTRLALGATTKLVNGRPNPTLAAAVAELEGAMDVVLDLLQQPGASQAQIDAARAKVTAEALKIQALDAQRIGFFLTVSGGQVWEVAADDVRNVVASRRAVWVTPAYRVVACSTSCEATLDFVAVWRLLSNAGTDAVTDYGGRVVWRPTRQFDVSLEVLRRHGATMADGRKTGTNRTAAMLEYRIRDDLAVYGSFGEDFEQATGVKPLISMLGVNIGFGSKARAIAGSRP